MKAQKELSAPEEFKFYFMMEIEGKQYYTIINASSTEEATKRLERRMDRPYTITSISSV